MLSKSESIVLQALIAAAPLANLRRARKALEGISVPGESRVHRTALAKLDECIAYRVSLESRESVAEL